METGLRDRVAIVAGSSQGIGRAAAEAFAAEGAHLALCSRNAETLVRVADEIRQRFSVQVYTAPIDVGDPRQIQSFTEAAAGQFGRIDICVTNAGGPPSKGFLETTVDEWDRAFDLNLRSAADFARAVIPYMQRAHWGRIVTISSIAVKQPQPELILSNAIRSGILGLVRSLANEFGRDGILVNNVAPGYTATERLIELAARRSKATGQTQADVARTWTDDIPLGRLGKPEEVAAAVVWFASEQASFITGQTLLVDGGMYKGL